MGCLETKWKNKAGKWQEMRADDCYGSTLRDLFALWQGCEVVTSIKSDRGTTYLCGKDEWIEYYQSRGNRAISFDAALANMKRHGEPDWLDDVLIPESFKEAFGDVKGIEIEKVVWGADTES